MFPASYIASYERLLRYYKRISDTTTDGNTNKVLIDLDIKCRDLVIRLIDMPTMNRLSKDYQWVLSEIFPIIKNISRLRNDVHNVKEKTLSKAQSDLKICTDEYDKIVKSLKNKKIVVRTFVKKTIGELSDLEKKCRDLICDLLNCINERLDRYESIYSKSKQIFYNIAKIFLQLDRLKEALSLQPSTCFVLENTVVVDPRMWKLATHLSSETSLETLLEPSLETEEQFKELKESPKKSSKVFSHKDPTFTDPEEAKKHSLIAKCQHGRGNSMREFAITLSLTHRNIVQALYYQTEKWGGTLALDKGMDNLQVFRRGNLSTLFTNLVSIAKQILQAVGYMHFHGFIHRDLKAENIVVFYIDPENSELYIKIIDLGFAVSRIETDDIKCQLCGTPTHLSPQIAQASLKQSEGRYVINEKDDGWAIGVTLLFLVNGELFFYSLEGVEKKELLQFIANLQQKYIDDYVQHIFDVIESKRQMCEKDIDQLKKLILSLLKINPEERKTPDEALQEFFTDNTIDPC